VRNCRWTTVTARQSWNVRTQNAFSLPFASILVNCAPSGEIHNYCTPHITENFENFLIHRCNYILLSQVYCVWQVVKTPTVISNNPVFPRRWLCLALHQVYQQNVEDVYLKLMQASCGFCNDESVISPQIDYTYFELPDAIVTKWNAFILEMTIGKVTARVRKRQSRRRRRQNVESW
jgi:hypothetical protein